MDVWILPERKLQVCYVEDSVVPVDHVHFVFPIDQHHVPVKRVIVVITVRQRNIYFDIAKAALTNLMEDGSVKKNHTELYKKSLESVQ